LAQSAKNRAFRSNSSDLLMQILWDFRFNPLRGGSSEPVQEIAYGNFRRRIIAASAIMRG
jgi:hypothetical protein